VSTIIIIVCVCVCVCACACVCVCVSPSLQEAYGSVVEYFGENPKTTQPSAFFPTFVRFIKAYKVSQPSQKSHRGSLLAC